MQQSQWSACSSFPVSGSCVADDVGLLRLLRVLLRSINSTRMPSTGSLSFFTKINTGRLLSWCQANMQCCCSICRTEDATVKFRYCTAVINSYAKVYCNRQDAHSQRGRAADHGTRSVLLPRIPVQSLNSRCRRSDETEHLSDRPC